MACFNTIMGLMMKKQPEVQNVLCGLDLHQSKMHLDGFLMKTEVTTKSKSCFHIYYWNIQGDTEKTVITTNRMTSKILFR